MDIHSEFFQSKEREGVLLVVNPMAGHVAGDHDYPTSIINCTGTVLWGCARDWNGRLYRWWPPIQVTGG